VDFQRRTLLAIVLCVLIWIVYAAFLAPPPPEPRKDVSKTTSVAKTDDADDDAAPPVAKPDGDQPAAPAADGKPATPEVAAVQHRVATELLALDVGNIGGFVRKTELLSPQFRRGDVGDDFLALGEKATLSVSFDAEYDDERLDLQIPRSAGWEVVDKSGKQWSLRHKTLDAEVIADLELTEGYEGIFNVKVMNRSPKRQSHRMLVRTQLGLAKEESSYDVHRGLCALANSGDVEAFAQGDVADAVGRSQGQIRWAGLDSKYFIQALVPEHRVTSCEVSLNKDATAMVSTVGSDKVILEPNETRTYKFGVYFGTKEVERLERYAVMPGMHLEDAVEWGWFGGLTRFLGEKMLWLLRVFYGLTGIWGVAIILLTIVVKVLTLPLTFKQMSSMKRMKEVQPELEALKKKYADDRVRQAQEMQALFQRSGVKPLAGCLPMLVQLPIWIALYAMLNTAVELYREPFLWLPDLTQQDPFYILPLAMGALMYFQMRMSPSGMDNEQARMMAWMMPIIFTVMMLFLPSGLGVYIFANVVLSLIQTAIQLRTSPQAPKKS
jgi:YidC/Oxa1 family membrane protein insertase